MLKSKYFLEISRTALILKSRLQLTLNKLNLNTLVAGNYLKINFKKLTELLLRYINNITNLVVFAIMTWFMFSVIRISIYIPQLFRESSAMKFDYGRGTEGYIEKYSNASQRQVGLLFSEFGFFQFNMLSIPFFLITGIVLFSIESHEVRKIKKIWLKVLSNSLAIAGLLVTVFSVWRA